jgi:hypothetical protein
MSWKVERGSTLVRAATASLITLCLASGAVAQKKAREAKDAGLATPNVGEIAPPLGAIPWIQLDEASDPKRGGNEPTIEALRGTVTIVTTYGYYCDTCIRAGVPTANALREANPIALRVVSLTLGIGDDTPEKIREEAQKLGIKHSVGQGDAEGTTSPYLNMSVNPSLTYAFVITRTGGVLWKGDPSREHDAYLAAVSRALDAVPAEPLPASMAPELAPAVQLYINGDFMACDATLQAIAKKLGVKSTPALDRARADAGKLAALIETTKKNLMDELERNGGAEKPEPYQRARENVLRAFPKGPCADRAGELDMFMCIQKPHGPECKRWSEWFALEAARPPTFPCEKDKLTTKYSKDLAKYLKGGDLPGVEQVRRWLDAFAKVPERK